MAATGADAPVDIGRYEAAAQPYVDRVLALGAKQYSDLISTVVEDGKDKTLQWVDLVMAGGGMLGIAHVGATYVFEKAGLRFHNIGGASAGAINAALVVTKRGEKPDAPSSLNTLRLMANFDFRKFQDDKDSKALWDFAQQAMADGKLSNWEKAQGAWQGLRQKGHLQVWNRLGLHPGDFFESWIKGQMSDGGLATVRALNQRLKLDSIDSLKIRDGAASATTLDDVRQGKMVLIASDITTQTKAEFPEHAKLYWDNPEDVHPGIFVRASMSVPGFFTPVTITKLPSGPAAEANWQKVGFSKAAADKAWAEAAAAKAAKLAAAHKPVEAPESLKVHLVDGGILSNFPINAFHLPSVPLLPTFGVRFGRNRETHSGYADSTTPLDFAMSLFESSRHILDRDFINKNPDYTQLITNIDDTGFGWLDFNLPNDRKVALFAAGAKAAAEFLERFDWAKYKDTRKFLLDARTTSKAAPGAPMAQSAAAPAAPITPERKKAKVAT
ncbi:hypothetical protein WJX72_005958 [[Myrmecia] bisecta]|uniref:Patatin n=1 Tax=[Myrmecia] bisecta TaxID=41462 RepID=A0AAW1PBY4_9CHLO